MHLHTNMIEEGKESKGKYACATYIMKVKKIRCPSEAGQMAFSTYCSLGGGSHQVSKWSDYRWRETQGQQGAVIGHT